MFDLREYKTIDLKDSTCLKENKTYKITDEITGKPLIVKLMEDVDTGQVDILVEFRKLALLSDQPEFATVGYLAESLLNGEKLTCYVIDYVEGKTLDTFLFDSADLAIEIAFDIICQMASGLEKAHAADIMHNDFHSGNVLINNLLNVKIIDPLWRDLGKNIKESQKADLDGFKKLVLAILTKVPKVDIGKILLLESVCLAATSFKKLSISLWELWEISMELDYLSQEGIELLSIIRQQTILNFKLNMVIKSHPLPVPVNLIPALTEGEKKILGPESSFKKLGIKPFESRAERIEINKKFKMAFHELTMAGLCDCEVSIVYATGGIPIEGPFNFIYVVKLTIKALNWFRINEKTPFLPKPVERSIDQYILR